LISERLIFVFIHFESNLRAICEQQKKFMISPPKRLIPGELLENFD